MPSVRGNIHYTGNYWKVPSKESFSAENTSAGTTEATGRYRAQIELTNPPLKMSGEVRCLTVDGHHFEARGEITDVQHADSGFEIRGFILKGYDSGKHSTEPDYFHTHYTDFPLSGGCLAPKWNHSMTPIDASDIDVTD